MPDPRVLFLQKVKNLVSKGRCRFSQRTKNGRWYVDILLDDFGISVEEAWQHVLSLTPHCFVPDNKPEYYEGSDAHVYEKEVNETVAYIKLAIRVDEEDEYVECVSFHEDER